MALVQSAQRLRSVVRSTRFLTVVVLILLVLRFAAYVTLQNESPLGFDGRAYLAAAHAITKGQNPYDPEVLLRVLPADAAGATVPAYLYPPLLALLLTPLTTVSFTTAVTIWVAVVAVSVVMLAALLGKLIGWRIASLATFGLTHTWHAIWIGQINAVIAALMVLALLSLSQRREGHAGAWLAFGGLLKITPAVSLVVLARRGMWRSVIASLVIASVLIMLTLPIVGLQSWRDSLMIAALYSSNSSTVISWPGQLYYWFGSTGRLLAVPVIGALIALTVIRASMVSLMSALAAAFLLPLLVARIAWGHHILMALPALAVLYCSTPRGRALAVCSWITIALFSDIYKVSVIAIVPVIPYLSKATIALALTFCWIACCWPELLGDEPAPLEIGKTHA